MYETGLHVASRDLVGVQLKTQLLGRPEREPNGEFSMPGYGAYLTSDERWIYLLMLNDAHWYKFAQAMELAEAADASLATLRQRKKEFERAEGLVKAAVATRTFDDIAGRLKAAGVGFTEVLPLEDVLQAPQARQPGKLRPVSFRGYDFEVPEFPRLNTDEDPIPTTPPAHLGEHTVELLRSIGLTADECEALLATKAATVAGSSEFEWAAVRNAASA